MTTRSKRLAERQAGEKSQERDVPKSPSREQRRGSPRRAVEADPDREETAGEPPKENDNADEEARTPPPEAEISDKLVPYKPTEESKENLNEENTEAQLEAAREDDAQEEGGKSTEDKDVEETDDEETATLKMTRAMRSGKQWSNWTADEDRRLRELVKKHKERNWKVIAEELGGRTSVQCLQHWKHVLNPDVGKGAWTPKEDEKLLELVEKFGKKWSTIAEHMPRRIGKRCRERYVNHLDPNLRKDDWQAEEEVKLLELRESLGNKWAEIAKLLPGRSVNSVKNHWYSLTRRNHFLVAGPKRQLDKPNSGSQPPSKRQKAGANTGPPRRWTKEEGEKLKELVEKYGPRKWLQISQHFQGRSDLQCLQHWQHVLNPAVVKGKGSWTPEEDKILVQKVQEIGKKWSKIALALPGRIGKQCRERYMNHLDPNLKRGPWSEEEERILIEAQKKLWNRWAEIAKLLPGRSDNDIKNHWYSSLQRRSSAGGVVKKSALPQLTADAAGERNAGTIVISGSRPEKEEQAVDERPTAEEETVTV